MCNYSNKMCHGLSLIGVMTVVGIIGIVLAVSVPAQIRSREIRHARDCQENMSRIHGAMEAVALTKGREAGEAITLDDLVATTGTGMLNEIPHCPAGGTYTVTELGEKPKCSISENNKARYAPHIYTTAIPTRSTHGVESKK